MPVSGLVLTLDPGERSRRGVLYVLSHDPRISVGELVEDRLPIVTETFSLEEGEDVAEQLLQVPGIRFVDVVSVDFSDIAEVSPGPARRSTRRARRPVQHAASQRR